MFFLSLAHSFHRHTKQIYVCIGWQTLSPRYLWHQPKCIISRHSFFAFIFSEMTFFSLFIFCWLCSVACWVCFFLPLAHIHFLHPHSHSHLNSFTHSHSCTTIHDSEKWAKELVSKRALHIITRRINRVQKQKPMREENVSTQQIMDVFCINIERDIWELNVLCDKSAKMLRNVNYFLLCFHFFSRKKNFSEKTRTECMVRCGVVTYGGSQSDVTKYITISYIVCWLPFCIFFFHFVFLAWHDFHTVPTFHICQLYPCYTSLKNVDKVTKQKRK